MILPTAKPRTITLSDRSYRGANPEYRDVNILKPELGPHYVKSAKGVPFRRLNK